MPKIAFDPKTDGFPFPNSWTLDPATVNELGENLNAARDMINKFLAPFPWFVRWHPLADKTAEQLIATATTQTFGLCGGMAFAALDYKRAGRKIPDGPRQTDKLSPELRRYIQGRMKKSLCPENLGRVLAWMVILHLPTLGLTRRLLCNLSRTQWKELKHHIDNDGPWPIALITETKNPCDNHQVLAYDYVPGDEQGTILVYDVNYPGEGSKIALDFTGPAFKANEECPDDRHIIWRGFFCEEYSYVKPQV